MLLRFAPPTPEPIQITLFAVVTAVPAKLPKTVLSSPLLLPKSVLEPIANGIRTGEVVVFISVESRKNLASLSRLLAGSTNQRAGEHDFPRSASRISSLQHGGDLLPVRFYLYVEQWDTLSFLEIA